MVAREVAWREWLARWDAQQTGYMPYRERRFAAMVDVVEAHCGRRPRAIDLACGPGSLARRLLDRLPGGRVVAVDFDPVLLEIGRRAIGNRGGRLAWVEADLRRPGWADRLPAGPYDAVLSTTALHWLTPAQLRRVYRSLHGLLRPGGAFLNGDHMGFPPSVPTLRALARRIDRSHRAAAARGHRPESWDTWWQRLGRERALAPLLAERRRRFPEAHHAEMEHLARFHERALTAAGFREVAVVWQELDNRVVLGIA